MLNALTTSAYTLLLICCTALAPASALAQAPPDGDWEGVIHVGEMDLGIRVHFEMADSLRATIDIPAQGAYDLALQQVRYDAPDVVFELPAGPGLAVFDGQLEDDGTIRGEFTQGGIQGTFYMQPMATPAGDEPAEAAAPEPAPYPEEDVRFRSGEATLAGTLALPEGDGPFPALILVSGSGPQDRDEAIAGFRPFRLLTDHLVQHGIAVLRYDDRGVGASTGSMDSATTATFTGDVLAALDSLGQHSALDADRIGILGHSEGGLVAVQAANRSEGVSFVVLMATPALRGDSLLATQLRAIGTARGVPAAALEEQAALQRDAFQTLRTDPYGPALEEDVRALLRSQLATLPEEFRRAPDDLPEEFRRAPDDLPEEARREPEDLPEEAEKTVGEVNLTGTYLEEAVAGQLEMLRTPWFRSFIDYDPRADLSTLRVPVLALFGGLDTQVPPVQNAPAMAAALEQGITTPYAIETFPRANHLFQQANTGSPTEYGTLENAFVPGFLDALTAWLQRTTARP